MNEIKKILHKFRVTHYKMKEITVLQKQVNQYSNILNKIKKIYAAESDIDIKKKLLLIEYKLIKLAEIKNNKAGDLLDKFDIYIHDTDKVKK